MSTVAIRTLRGDLPFGARISGVTFDALEHDRARRRIAETLVERGIVLFEGVEQSSKMQNAISNLFGPLTDYPIARVERVDQGIIPAAIIISTDRDRAQIFRGASRMVFSMVGAEMLTGDEPFDGASDAAPKVMKSYEHHWQGNEMLVWDNSRIRHWRMPCSAGGQRVSGRATLNRNHDLGHWQNAGRASVAEDDRPLAGVFL